MNALPDFNGSGDLPPGVHQVTLAATLKRFGQGSVQRYLMAERLRRIYELAAQTGHLARFIIFGSFITAHPWPNDVDVFLLIDDPFDAGELSEEADILFNHRDGTRRGIVEVVTSDPE